MNALVLRMKVWLRKQLHCLRIRILGKNAVEQAWETLAPIAPDASPEELANAVLGALRHADDFEESVGALFESGCPTIRCLVLERYGPDDSLWHLLEQQGIIRPGHAHSQAGVEEFEAFLRCPAPLTAPGSLLNEVVA